MVVSWAAASNRREKKVVDGEGHLFREQGLPEDFGHMLDLGRHLASGILEVRQVFTDGCGKGGALTPCILPELLTTKNCTNGIR